MNRIAPEQLRTATTISAADGADLAVVGGIVVGNGDSKRVNWFVEKFEIGIFAAFWLLSKLKEPDTPVIFNE